MGDLSLWLSTQEAAEYLKETFGVEYAIRTIDNKCYRGEIESKMIAGKRRINRTWLHKWALMGDEK